MLERPLKALAIALALFLPVGLSLSLAADTKSERKTDTKSERKKSESKLSKDDERFVKDAAAGGMMEVELGKMAASDQVKEFGRRMQEVHGKANAELKTIAANKGVELSKGVEGKHKKTIDRLSKLSGEEFDRQYMRAMVEAHEEDLKKFEREAEKGKDPDVKQFASKYAPVLKKHLELAKTTEQQVKKSVRPSPAKESPAKDKGRQR
jgi:putative membrane protein